MKRFPVLRILAAGVVWLILFILAFSFYTYSAHWWTDTDGSLAAAALQ